MALLTRRIRVQSSALGFPATVDVYVYPTLEAMRAAAQRYSPHETFTRAAAVTHATTIERVDQHGNVTHTRTLPIVRLTHGHLGTEVIAHELHHATSAIYGATLPHDLPARDVLHNANEPFAYLHGELTYRLVNRLYAHGYYDQDTP